MARLRDTQPKNVSGAYIRLFGNVELGTLASMIQSAVIKSGHELEKIISDKVKNIDDLDSFLERETMPDGVLIARKRQIRRSNILNFAGAEPDFMVFKRRNRIQTCHIVELKDGHVFDTKKANAERQAMHRFIERIAPHIQYRFQAHFCAFNQDDRNTIWEGFKKRIDLSEAMTGRELCDLLEIDCEAIVAARMADGPDNIVFFLSELLEIDVVKERLGKLLDG